jgi:DNA-binding NarL/FixJ family response regulator
VNLERNHKVFLVDDHKLFREGLAFVISQMNGFEVVGEASNGYAFLQVVDNLDVDIVLMDISMPGLDGITTSAMALIKRPDLKIIALTMFSDEEYYYKMVQTGVYGYILKESGKDELDIALNTVVAGNHYFGTLSDTFKY